MERVSPMNGEEVHLSWDTPEPRCGISLTTLLAPPTDILLRKTRAKRTNSADRVVTQPGHPLAIIVVVCSFQKAHVNNQMGTAMMIHNQDILW